MDSKLEESRRKKNRVYSKQADRSSRAVASKPTSRKQRQSKFRTVDWIRILASLGSICIQSQPVPLSRPPRPSSPVEAAYYFVTAENARRNLTCNYRTNRRARWRPFLLPPPPVQLRDILIQDPVFFLTGFRWPSNAYDISRLQTFLPLRGKNVTTDSLSDSDKYLGIVINVVPTSTLYCIM